jgi:hypothetical protein
VSRRDGTLLAAAFAARSLLACGPRGEPDADAPVRLRAWAPGGEEPHFEVWAESCPELCAFGVALVDGERIVARERLHWAGAEGTPTLGPIDAFAGAGDPLDPDALEREVPAALYTGDEASAVVTVARGVALGPGTVGLLVDQVAGFEHLKRAHFLFAAAGGRLARAWSYEEQAGPTWSTTALAALGPDRQAVVLLAGRTLAAELGDRPDDIERQVVLWDAASGAAVLRNEAVPIRAVSFGRFAGIAEARAAYEARADCLGDFSILPSERLARSGPPGELVLALLGVSEAGARERLAEAQTCAGGLPGSVGTLRP